MKTYTRTAEHNMAISKALKNHAMYASKERSEKIRQSRLGKKASLETRLKMSIARKGKSLGKRSDAYREKCRERMLGKKQDPETIRKRVASRDGYTHSHETRLKLSLSNKGKHTKINSQSTQNERKSFAYKEWRRAVFIRDEFTCIWCGIKSGCGKTVRFNADHIKPWAYYPDLRYDLNNGRTLCIDCHKKTDTYGGKVLRLKIG